MQRIAKPVFALVIFSLLIGFMNITISETYAVVGEVPFIDGVIYKVISNDDEQVLALENDEVDIIGDFIGAQYAEALQEAENIQVTEHPRNGYGYMTINCAKYPFNITSFRRALAFALDKNAISEDVWDGFAIPQDSVVPSVNPFSIEGQLPYTYYEGNTVIGNQLLDDAGFVDINNDGFREAPDGSDFDVLIEVAKTSTIGIETSEYFEDALLALSINAIIQPTDFYEHLNRLYYHGDYDIVFLGSSYGDFDVDWLAYEFWSEYADEDYWNFPNFRNASYDSWRDQLLYSTDYDDVYEAAIEMQKIWVYQCPMIICYENLQISAHRTDRFGGFALSKNYKLESFWTNLYCYPKGNPDGPYGGELRWSTPLDVETFDITDAASIYTRNVLDNLYDSLIRRDETGKNRMWLAESYKMETHDDNPEVSEGHSRFTLRLTENAVWSDGEPLTAEDVAYSLNYHKSGSNSIYAADLNGMVSATAMSTYQVVVDFDSESYWNLHSFCYKPIIPKHAWGNLFLTSQNEHNPAALPSPMVTSGPFNITDYSAGDYIELTRNPYYFSTGIEDLSSSTSPLVDSPVDFSYYYGDAGNNISWTVEGEYLSSYEILKNGSVASAGNLNSTLETIEINIDGLDVGTYNYTLVVQNAFGQKGSDTVFVTVSERAAFPALSEIPELMAISLAITSISVIVIVVLLVQLIRNRT